MSPVIKTKCSECGRKIKCSAKYGAKIFSCNQCASPECPLCSGVDIIYKVAILNRKKTTVVEKCLDINCQWSLDMARTGDSKKQKIIEVITID